MYQLVKKTSHIVVIEEAKFRSKKESGRKLNSKMTTLTVIFYSNINISLEMVEECSCIAENKNIKKCVELELWFCKVPRFVSVYGAFRYAGMGFTHQLTPQYL
jgi:hypothetical protein